MLDRSAVYAWLQDLGVDVPTIESLVVGDTTDASNLVRLAGKRCYMAWGGDGKFNKNVQRVREDVAKYIDHILEVGHGSVIEHVSYSFAIEGISRVLTAELNRHRAGCAISEGSMRFIRFNDLPYWLPDSIEDGPDDSVEVLQKKSESRAIFRRAFGQAEHNYNELETLWASELAPESKFSAKKQVTSMMRRVVPIGVSTGGVWTFNLRALRHVATMRCDESAEEEILALANKILEHMLTSELHFFGDFKKNERGYYAPKHRKV
jgi:thymidylate synthase (FAD)